MNSVYINENFSNQYFNILLMFNLNLILHYSTILLFLSILLQENPPKEQEDDFDESEVIDLKHWLNRSNVMQPISCFAVSLQYKFGILNE